MMHTLEVLGSTLLAALLGALLSNAASSSGSERKVQGNPVKVSRCIPLVLVNPIAFLCSVISFFPNSPSSYLNYAVGYLVDLAGSAVVKPREDLCTLYCRTKTVERQIYMAGQ